MNLRFFRVQGKGHSFKEMCAHTSAGADEGSEGLAASGSPDGRDGGSRFGGAWDAMDDDDEVIVLEGTIIERLYDGYRIAPEREVARFTIAEWSRMLRSGEAWEYEA